MADQTPLGPEPEPPRTDPDRILEDATPCMAANGVDPDRARGLVIKTFGS